MRHLLPLPSLFALLIMTAMSWAGDGKVKHRISFHSEGIKEDGESRVFPHKVLNETRFFQLSPEVTQIDFSAFTAFRSEDGATWGATFFLDVRGAAKLSQLSSAKPGGYVLVAIDGKPVDYMLIDKPIHNGIISVWRGFNEEHIQFLEKDLKLPVVRTPKDVPAANRGPGR